MRRREQGSQFGFTQPPPVARQAGGEALRPQVLPALTLWLRLPTFQREGLENHRAQQAQGWACRPLLVAITVPPTARRTTKAWGANAGDHLP